MKAYLLDANVVISLLNDPYSSLGRRVRAHDPREICISSIVIHELFYGAFKSQRVDSNVALVHALQFDIFEFNKEDARHAGEIRAILVQEGKPIGPYDVLIAGQAKARDLILVTHNGKEFRRVKGLLTEDWESS